MPNTRQNTQDDAPDYTLDITADVCPLTFVRTKLLIERMAPGTIAEVLLKGEEPLRNIPKAVIAQGHAVLALAPVVESRQVPVVHRLLFRKQARPTVVTDSDAR